MRRLLACAVLFLLSAAPLRAETVIDAARAVEADLGGRVGVMLRAPGSTPLAAWRADERFPLSSTFKTPLCGAVLARVDAGKEQRDRLVSYAADALVTYSPVTEKHVGTGMTIDQLCAATITLSDNTAGNLLLKTLGGPAGLTAFLRTLGDQVSRLDRWETALNEGVPGDTTSPAAITTTLETLLFSAALSPDSRAQLETWMQQDQVADALIRKHLPEGWSIGDKTGAGGHGSRSIIAVIRTPQGSPWLAAIYLTGNTANMDARNAAIARIGAAMFQQIGAQPATGTSP
jgi:beta-lactamase class A